MMLFTDRPSEGHRLVAALGLTGNCHVVGVHQAHSRPQPVSIVISDISLHSLAATELLQSVLTKFREAGPIALLFIARDQSHLTTQLAKAFGADIIVSSSAPSAEIAAALRSLRTKVHGASDRSTVRAPISSGQMKAAVAQAGGTLSSIFRSISRTQPISRPVLVQGGEAVIGAIGQAGIQRWVDVVWRYDDVTYQHCLLVAGLVAALSFRLGLSLAHQRLLSQAALVHDVGKASIPRAILNKAGPLSPEEMKVMQTHAAEGYNLLVHQRGFDERLLDVARHHHEYIDGTGYPDGLRGEQICQFVRLTTICDIYAALIERRSYKEPLSAEVAISILQSMRGKLDDGLLVTFASMIRNTKSPVLAQAAAR